VPDDLKHRPHVTLRGGLWRVDCCTETRGDWFTDQNPAMTHATKHAKRQESMRALSEAAGMTIAEVKESITAWLDVVDRVRAA
jgi:hypothetical protein